MYNKEEKWGFVGICGDNFHEEATTGTVCVVKRELLSGEKRCSLAVTNIPLMKKAVWRFRFDSETNSVPTPI
jgi:hypothetical protein